MPALLAALCMLHTGLAQAQAQPTVSLDPAPLAVNEGATASITVNISPPPAAALTIRYTLGVDADADTADADSADYTHSDSLQLTAGSGVIAIPITDDEVIEAPQEVFTVTLDAPEPAAGYTLGSQTTVTVTITEGVCDRTEQVRDHIVALARAPNVSDCALVTAEHLANITNMSLISRSITTLQAGDFQGLTLGLLRLSNNPLQTLPETLFDGLSVNDLDLSNNQLQTLPEALFDGLDMDDLNLSRNQLQTLPETLFDGLDMDDLDLSRNQLQTLPADLFDDLSVVNLYLSDNQLQTLPETLFDGLSVNNLDLSDNQLQTLPADLFDSLSVSDLDLSDNQLQTLPETLFDGLSVNNLDLSDNQLQTLPADLFDGLSVINLNLSANQLHTLTEGVFEGLRVRSPLGSLDLSGNPGNRDEPFALTVEIERVNAVPSAASPAEARLKLAEGIPSAVMVPLTVAGGTLSSTSASFAAGATTSDTFTAMGTETTTISLGTLPALPGRYRGLQLTGGDPLVLFGTADSTAPTVTSAAITSAPASSQTYAAGEFIEVTLTFSETVIVATATGRPGLSLRVGTATHEALYTAGGRSMTTLVFRYPVAEGDMDSDGISWADDALHLNEGGLTDRAGNAAILTVPAQTDAVGHKVSAPVNEARVCDRTERVREWILSQIPGVDDCAMVAVQHLAGISGSAELRGKISGVKKIAALKAGDFRDLSVLDLKLSFNDLTTLPAGVFDGLHVMRDLELHNNALERLPAGVFDGLRLRDLDLSSNELTMLPTGIFDGLHVMRDLDLSGNPGTPFTLTVEIEPVNAVLSATSPADARLKLAAGTPSAITVPLTVAGGTLSSTSASFAAGATTSDTFTAMGTGTTTISLGTLPALPGRYRGLQLTGGDPLVLFGTVDSTAPTVTSAAITSAPASSQTYAAGEFIEVTLTFSETVIVTTATGQPSLSLQVGTATREALYTSGGRSMTTLVFRYPVAEGDMDSDGISWADDALHLNGGGLTDRSDNAAILTVAAQTDAVGHQVSAPVNEARVCDRTEQVREWILSQIQGVDDCAMVTVQHLAGISGSAELGGIRSGVKKITALKAGDFRDLSVLDLDLSFNNLTTLPAGVFDGLRLRDLDLSFNNLTTLPAGVFDGLHVRDLGLSSNKLMTLPAGVFDRLRVDGSLELHNNALERLPAGVFDGLRLRDLDLSSNKLMTLPAGIFDGLRVDDILELSSNPGNLGTPFTLTVEIEPVNALLIATSPADARLKLAAGIPRAITVPLTVAGGTLSSTSASFAAGATTSDTFTAMGTETTTISLGTLPALPSGYRGLQLTGGGPLVLFRTVDSTAPTVTSAAITSAPASGQTYAAGEFIEVTLTFSETVIVATTTGRPSLSLRVGTATHEALYTAGGRSMTTLMFRYPVAEGDMDSDGISWADDALHLNGGGLTDRSGNAAILTVAAQTDAVGHKVSAVVNEARVCDRTERVREWILSQIQGVDDCAMVTVQHLAGISGSVELEGSRSEVKKITALKAGDFRDLSVLDLKLSFNNLTTLPAGVFDGLRVRDLDLSFNNLTTLPAGVFDGLHVRDLDLSSNELMTLPAGVFDRLRVDGSLELHNNALERLPAGVFDGLRLRDLDLSSNELTTLPAGMFDGLHVMRDLDLSGNLGTPFTLTVEIEPVNAVLSATSPADARLKLAAGTPSAITVPLTVAGGTLSSTSASFAAGATTSDTFTAMGTGTTTISLGTLPALPSGYRGLQLTGGDPLVLFGTADSTAPTVTSAAITSAPASSQTYAAGEFIEVTLTFSETVIVTTATGQPSLSLQVGTATREALYTSGGRSMTTLVFRYPVAEGDMDSDGISWADDALHLNGGGLTDRSDNAAILTVAAQTDAVGHQVSAPVNEARVCDRTEQVREWILSQIQGVDDCAMVTVQHLAGISGSAELGGIRSGVKKITALKAGDFRDLSVLDLDLSFNNLTTLPAGVFDGLHVMRDLDLSFNNLTTLPASVFDGLHVRDLGLSSNKLMTLPAGVFDGLRVRDLDLSFNNLTTLPAGVFDGLRVRDLDLSSNKLMTLPAGIFDGLRVDDILELSRNPGNLGTPFALTVEIEPVNAVLSATSPADARLKLAEGIPRAVTVPLTVAGGILSSSSAGFAAGATTSDTFTATGFGTTTLSPGPLLTPHSWVGLQLVGGAPLVLPFATNADFTGSGVTSTNAKVLYYALAQQLGDHERMAALDSIVPEMTDAEQQNMLMAVTALAAENPEALDFNADKNVDIQDAVLFYYAQTLSGSLGDGTADSGFAAIRETILGPFVSHLERYEDQHLQDILTRINDLVKPP